MAQNEQVDVIIIGAGMAGATLAAQLGPTVRVTLLEMEPHAGMHSTGRSAALFAPNYGNAAIRALTRASADFLFAPPAGFSETALVSPRGTLYFSGPGRAGASDAFLADPDRARTTWKVTLEEAEARVPVFRDRYLTGAVFDPHSADMDVAALHMGYLRQAKAAGARLITDASDLQITRAGADWRVHAKDTVWQAPILVNAAGAWADEVAGQAGLTGLGLQPLRRTVVLLERPDGLAPDAPCAVDMDETFYFKPDAGLLLLCPADETPSPACDAQPEELDIAIAVDRYEQATGLSVRAVKRAWAGLRVFASDRTPVVGFDPRAEGFFWLAGLGGYGIQTAPAMGRFAAALVSAAPIPADISAEAAGLDLPTALAPSRLV
jgi:D-arginine dehydrogenase